MFPHLSHDFLFSLQICFSCKSSVPFCTPFSWLVLAWRLYLKWRLYNQSNIHVLINSIYSLPSTWCKIWNKPYIPQTVKNRPFFCYVVALPDWYAEKEELNYLLSLWFGSTISPILPIFSMASCLKINRSQSGLFQFNILCKEQDVSEIKQNIADEFLFRVNTPEYLKYGLACYKAALRSHCQVVQEARHP